MAAFVYPFQSIRPKAPTRPVVPVRVFNPDTGKSVLVWALIDTGADSCAFPAHYAVMLGHNLTAGAARNVGTGNGKAKVYAHTTRVEVPRHIGGKYDFSLPAFTIQATPIDFMPNLHMALLGAADFLSRFTLLVDYPHQTFTLQD